MNAADFAALFPNGWSDVSAFLFRSVALGWLAGFIGAVLASARPR